MLVLFSLSCGQFSTWQCMFNTPYVISTFTCNPEQPHPPQIQYELCFIFAICSSYCYALLFCQMCHWLTVQVQHTPIFGLWFTRHGVVYCESCASFYPRGCIHSVLGNIACTLILLLSLAEKCNSLVSCCLLHPSCNIFKKSYVAIKYFGPSYIFPAFPTACSASYYHHVHLLIVSSCCVV